MNNVIYLYCRHDFEKGCAVEIIEKAAERELYSIVRMKENSGYVVFVCYQHEEVARLIRTLPLRSVILRIR
ncbi:hypothetical protein [Sodalis sp.]|uniref:hypothetical protein n=1 Tax=Sodalis sp. (in: enterobacteria) TaxID=1898979 RepID=UPI00387323BA